MKSQERIYITKKELDKTINDEVKKRCEYEYTQAFFKATYQALAVVLCVLAKDYGFTEKQLKSIKDGVEEQFIFMANGFMGRKYGVNDCILYLKKHYNIDFESSVYQGWDKECK